MVGPCFWLGWLSGSHTKTSRRMRGFSPLKGFMKKADYESVVAWTPRWTPRTRRPPDTMYTIL